MRKKPHILYWATSLIEVKKGGGNILNTISLWDQSQSMCEADQLKRPKRDAVINITTSLPEKVMDLALEHVDEVGDFNLSGSLMRCIYSSKCACDFTEHSILLCA